MVEVKAICHEDARIAIHQKLCFIDPIPKVSNSFQYLFGPPEMPFGEINPPITLDRNYFDLGAKTMSSGDAAKSAFVTATNKSLVSILLRWRKGSDYHIKF